MRFLLIAAWPACFALGFLTHAAAFPRVVVLPPPRCDVAAAKVLLLRAQMLELQVRVEELRAVAEETCGRPVPEQPAAR